MKEVDSTTIGIWESSSSMEKDCDEFEFLKIRNGVKINQMPGQWLLGRKDCFTVAYNKMKQNNASYNFYPNTFLLPEDIELLKDHIKNERRVFLIKPVNWFSGLGIKITDSVDDLLSQGGRVVVQEYIERPLLINQRKCDVRLFLLITSVDPLILYIYNDGIVSFCCEHFSSGDFSNKFKHLTNYSINKNHESYEYQDHRWRLRKLLKHLTQEFDVDSDKLWEETKEICLKTVLCTLDQLREEAKNKTKCHYNNYKLFSVDVMYDEDFKPWVLEVCLVFYESTFISMYF